MITYEDLRPGMWVRPAGTLDNLRRIDEVEHLGSRVMIGYTDDQINVTPYPDTTPFDVGPHVREPRDPREAREQYLRGRLARPGSTRLPNPGSSTIQTLCGAPLTDRDLDMRSARARGGLDWVGCPQCRDLVTEIAGLPR